MPARIKLYALIGTYMQYYDDPEEGRQEVWYVNEKFEVVDITDMVKNQ